MRLITSKQTPATGGQPGKHKAGCGVEVESGAPQPSAPPGGPFGALSRRRRARQRHKRSLGLLPPRLFVCFCLCQPRAHLLNTTFAASGSPKMFASAAGLTLPLTCRGGMLCALWACCARCGCAHPTAT